ncbi:hypothetical protein V6N13_017626 [Hibiscus sabdariffa]
MVGKKELGWGSKASIFIRRKREDKNVFEKDWTATKTRKRRMVRKYGEILLRLFFMVYLTKRVGSRAEVTKRKLSTSKPNKCIGTPLRRRCARQKIE